MKIHFVKMSGAGNDFVVIDNRRRRIKNGSALARTLCDRRHGIGADGLLLIERSRSADYTMKYYNADGSSGSMCGNGGRCIAYYAWSAGVAKASHHFEALQHIYHAKIGNTSVTLTMKDPSYLRTNILLRVDKRRFTVHYIDTGSPHVILPLMGKTQKKGLIDRVDVRGLGQRIRHHSLFKPNGCNVNFLERIDAKTLKMRTYERGVEDETLACGTGAVACAIVGHFIWGMEPPVRIITRGGEVLIVSFRILDNGTINEVKLTGSAKEVFRGVINA
jgi:diaminopimelate epimerase